ncbi:MAG: SufS family cysteine desulfurase [Patescibacteria group bacterium]|jgi:cysteine desulfurase/selenocysteine lyase
MLNTTNIRKDFPIFTSSKNLVYLDSAATALKPRAVIDAMHDYYEMYSANIHRGIYGISEKATQNYEAARDTAARFIHAASRDEIVFTHGTTEGLNLLAYTLGRLTVDKNSEIVVSMAEHHSNFVPWQQLVAENGAQLKVIDTDEEGIVPLDTVEKAERIITEKTKLVCLYFVSNVLGTMNPIRNICAAVKKVNPKTIVIIDAAQAAPSQPIDVQELGCDFMVFSSHKMCGPTGFGVLWGRKALLEELPPFQFGGDMIERVTLSETAFKTAPGKFEAGTPHIAGAIGLDAALKYLETVSLAEVFQHELRLGDVLRNELKKNKYIELISPAESKYRTGIVTFNHKKVHPHDLASVLAKNNVCIRAGHHCAMPLHEKLGLAASARVSLYLYNNEFDIEMLLSGISRAEKIFL